MDDGRDRLRVMPEASQQARFSLVTFFCRQKKVTQHDEDAQVLADRLNSIK